MPYLTLTYADGSEEVVRSDGAFRVTNNLGTSVEFGDFGLVGAAYSPDDPAAAKAEPKKSKK